MRGYYSQISNGYNGLHSEEQIKKAELIKSKISLEGLLLDIGAGTGISSREFSKGSVIVALDPCLEMLKQDSCRNFLRVCAKAEELPFKSDSFDSIVSITALHHASLKKSFVEIMRVSKKNAGIAVSFLKASKKIAFAKKIFSKFECAEEEKDIVFFLKRGKEKNLGK